jgi:arsenate reductase
VTPEPRRKPLVLFLCVHNACRSQLAEAILRAKAGDRLDVASAGLEPTCVHPLTIRALEEVGLPVAALRSKSASQFLGKASVRHAIILCPTAQASCPRIYPLATETLYWPFEDPTSIQGNDEARWQAVRHVRAVISARIDRWLHELRCDVRPTLDRPPEG